MGTAVSLLLALSLGAGDTRGGLVDAPGVAPTAPDHSDAPTGMLITAQALHALGDKVVVLDARSWDVYEDGHIPDAISVPWIELAQMPKSPVTRSVQEM